MSNKTPLRLDLENRYNSAGRAAIHAIDDPLAETHYAVAQVVVRMEGDEQDDPALVMFANAMVDRYNQHNELTEHRDALLAALQRLISSDPHIEMFQTSELEICANNEALPPTLREQAASVIQARAVIAMVKGGAVNHFPDVAKMVPDGWQLVPVEPTLEMISAATRDSVGFGTRAAYKAMLAAAPKHEGGAA